MKARSVGRLFILGCFALMSALAGLSLHAMKLYETPPHEEIGTVPFMVEKGESRASVISRLAEARLIPNSWVMGLVLRYRGDGGCIKAGEHQLDRALSPEDLLQSLCNAPKAKGHRFTIREGATLWEVERDLVRKGLAKPGELLAMGATSSLSLLESLPSAKRLKPGKYPSPLEGYLFPDTYQLPEKEPVQALVSRATAKMKRVLDSVAGELPSRAGLQDLHDLVTLASIVEREAVKVKEMPTIASVYLNRLGKEMKLQADPTMIHAPGTWSQAPSPKHRRNKSNRFNTYAHEGLPPGPIGAVGRDALVAVLQPASTDFIFFVALGDGSGRHAFARTYKEHKENVKNYRRALKAARDKSRKK